MLTTFNTISRRQARLTVWRGPCAGVYNEAALKALDYIVYRAGQYGVKLIAVLADNWQKADSTYNVRAFAAADQ